MVVGRLEKARHLINLLRPELVKGNKKPLSSDAFTFFGAHDAKIHNEEVTAGADFDLCALFLPVVSAQAAA